MMIKDLFISDYNCITPIGFDVDSNWNSLLQNISGIKPHKILNNAEPFFASIIDNENIEDAFQEKFNNISGFTRLEKLFLLVLQPVIEKNPISEKSVLILSTTKGNISALKNQNQLPQEVYLATLAQKIADFFGFKTKAIVVSNACVSGVMAISVAKNIINSGKYSDAFVIAGDEVTEFVMSGFNSFQAVVSEPCKPYDKNRGGINIGEAVAAAYISEKTSKNEKFSFKILGESAINDANHISGPSRTGEGLFRSVQNALKEAKLTSNQIDFISAHGTATLYNDEMEAIAFSRCEMQNIPLNSLKGFYGHTLGASGLLETIISMESAKRNTLIPTKNFEEMGVSYPINIITKVEEKNIQYFLKTASGFGGCNAALIVEKITI